MPTKAKSSVNGYQIRSDRTKMQVLEAAETVFVRDGYERAQMDGIAKAAGRSKGAIYAHYRSKEDLFFALLESRIRSEFERIADRIKTSPNKREAFRNLKKALAEISKNRSAVLLYAEGRLYALRNADFRERWSRFDNVFAMPEQVEILESALTRRPKEQAKGGLLRGNAIMPIIMALVLEVEFHPKRFRREDVTELLEDILDFLFAPLSPRK